MTGCALTIEGAGWPRAGHSSCVLVRRAVADDLDAICTLVDYWARQGENLPRPREDIAQHIEQFAVVVDAEGVIGCAALYPYSEELAEVRSLGVLPPHAGNGLGGRLVRFLLEQAVLEGRRRVFALTRAPGFFQRLGFERASIDGLPEKVWKDCQHCPKRHACDEVAMVIEPARGTAP